MRDSDKRMEVTRGSGDVFSDLGIELSREEQLKIMIAREISRVAEKNGYTQKQIGEIIGADQAKVSKITRGLTAGFSVERLFGYLLLLGIDLNISTSESGGPKGHVRYNDKVVLTA